MLSRCWRGLAQAWAVAPARRGFYGTVLITLGSLTPAFLPMNSPWWAVLDDIGAASLTGRIVGTTMILLGLGLLVDAWYRLRPGMTRPISHRAVLALWSLPFLLAPPIFSHDAYSYAAQGYLAANGVDPYQVGPGALPGDFADAVSRVWLHTPAPYGPLSIRIQQLLVLVCGSDPYASAVAMRIPCVIGVVLIALCLPRLVRHFGADEATTHWFVLLNPLLVIHFVGGSHNDALMVGLAVFALWLATHQRFWFAAVAAATAATIKQPGALVVAAVAVMAVPVAHRRWSEWRSMVRPVAGVGLAFVASFVGISLATGLNFGWANAVNVPGMVVTPAPTTLLGDIVNIFLMNFGYYEYTALITRTFRIIGMVATALLLGWMFLRMLLPEPMRFVSWGLLVFCLGGPALHGWYLLWGGVLLPLSRPGVRLRRIAMWLSVAFAFYSGINAAWRNGALTLGVIAALAATALVMVHERAWGSRRRHDTPTPVG